MSKSKMGLATLLAGCLAVTLVAAQKTTIQKTPAAQTSPANGKEMYESYCASCHGKDAKGDGPAASALKIPPADLTTLTRRNQGKFPALHVQQTILGDANVPAHGSKDMPVWGPVFRALGQGHASEMQMRTANLARYLETLQVK